MKPQKSRNNMDPELPNALKERVFGSHISKFLEILFKAIIYVFILNLAVQGLKFIMVDSGTEFKQFWSEYAILLIAYYCVQILHYMYQFSVEFFYKHSFKHKHA